MLDLSASTHTCCDSLDLIRVLPYPLRRSLPAVRHAQRPRCSSCHGTTDTKFGTTWLDGQALRLHQGATPSVRKLGNIARQMTATEMDQAARYYARRPWANSAAVQPKPSGCVDGIMRMHRCAKNSAGLLCGTSCGLWVAFTGLREVLSGHVWPFWLHYCAEEHTGALDPLSVKAEEQHWQRWQDRRGSRSFLAEHSETFQSISKHFVPIRCHCHSLRFVAECWPANWNEGRSRGRSIASWRGRLRKTNAAATGQQDFPCAHAGLQRSVSRLELGSASSVRGVWQENSLAFCWSAIRLHRYWLVVIGLVGEEDSQTKLDWGGACRREHPPG